MNSDEAFSILANAIRFQPAAFFTWSAVMVIRKPEDADAVKVIIRELLANIPPQPITPEPPPRLDLVNDFARSGGMLIGGPCIHGVSNNGFDCPKCHPPLDLEQAKKDSERELRAVLAFTAGGSVRPGAPVNPA